MISVRCIKEMPNLCKVGDVGTVEIEQRTIIETGRTSFYCNDPWHRVKRVSDVLSFKFGKKKFTCEDFLRTQGKHIELKEHFVRT